VHFKGYATEVCEYSINRFDFEAERHWKVLDGQLAKHRYTLGDEYTVVDMAVWGWARMVPRVLSKHEDVWNMFPNVKRLVDEINARDAVRGVERLLKQHTFKVEMDEESRRHMFPHLARTGTGKN
jgi:GST-like protein